MKFSTNFLPLYWLITMRNKNVFKFLVTEHPISFKQQICWAYEVQEAVLVLCRFIRCTSNFIPLYWLITMRRKNGFTLLITESPISFKHQIRWVKEVLKAALGLCRFIFLSPLVLIMLLTHLLISFKSFNYPKL